MSEEINEDRSRCHDAADACPTGSDAGGSIEDIYDRLCAAGDENDAVGSSISLCELNDREAEDRIRAVCVQKTGDSQYYDILDFRHDPVTAALRSLRRRSAIYVDMNATKELIVEEIGLADPEAVKSLPEIICVTDLKEAAPLAEKHGISPAAAGFLLRKCDLSGAILIIGRDEEALLSVCRLAERGVKPSLVLAFPCGTGNQNKSKSYLRELETAVASISTKSAKGGREPAAFCFSEIVAIWQEDLQRRR